jgi:hypothetical protein
VGCNRYEDIDGPDCSDTNTNAWDTCATCLDTDADTWYVGCNRYEDIDGPDCSDTNPNAWDTCATCVDNDTDGWYLLCNDYTGIDGPDCSDTNTNAWDTCVTCLDTDADTWYVGCNRYQTISGPDCNNSDGAIYPYAPELCDGIDNQCSGNPGYGTVDEGCDNDGDGLTNSDETNIYHTDPAKADTDGDGLGDYLEVITVPCFNELAADTDGDGLCDGNTTVMNGSTVVCVAGEDMDLNGVVNPGETNPCSADTDSDLINDYIEAKLSCSSPTNPDSDTDGLCDGNTTVMNGPTVVCVAGEDKNLNGDVDPGETDPCSPDSDSDTLSDGAEVKTYGTDPLKSDTDGDGVSDPIEIGLSMNPLYWDSDADGLPDKFEYDNMSGHTFNLDPNNPADGALNFDGDPNPNAHEYWNGSDPWTTNPVGAESCFYWAEGDGDGIVGPGDKSKLVTVMKGTSSPYSNVLPNNGETQELDMDLIPGPGDVSIITTFMKGNATVNLASRPTAITKVSADPVTVHVGDTIRVTVSVGNFAGKWTPGFGIVFTVAPGSTGAATIFGGDGAGTSGGRYDISAGIASHSPASVVIRVNTPGDIWINVKSPICGTVMNAGRSCPELILAPPFHLVGQ